MKLVKQEIVENILDVLWSDVWYNSSPNTVSQIRYGMWDKVSDIVHSQVNMNVRNAINEIS